MTDRKTTDDVHRELNEYKKNHLDVILDVYNRISDLQKTVDSFRASDRAWEEEKEFYDWCNTESFKEIVGRLDRLEQKLSAPKPQQSGSCFENGCDRFGWIHPETHADVVKKKDRMIEELEQKLDEFKTQCGEIKDLTTNILFKNGIFD